ncbi:MAG: hypothetical protein HQ591_09665 [candidate division Zixibacteria bacterium]|nr:hypothetical protein [Candidatus Tariuqbacter arcticus]
MISCEEFENRYPLDQPSEVLLHKKTCPYCSQYAEAIAFIRNSVAALPAICAPMGFEHRLQRRIESLESGNPGEWRILPKAVAFASGLAVVIIAGAIYHGVNNPSNPTMTAYSEVEEFAVNDAENDSTAADSVKIPLSPWADTWNIEAVSAQP